MLSAYFLLSSVTCTWTETQLWNALVRWPCLCICSSKLVCWPFEDSWDEWFCAVNIQVKWGQRQRKISSKLMLHKDRKHLSPTLTLRRWCLKPRCRCSLEVFCSLFSGRWIFCIHHWYEYWVNMRVGKTSFNWRMKQYSMKQWLKKESKEYEKYITKLVKWMRFSRI